LKHEELARRADEKLRQIQEAERKLGLKQTIAARSDSPMKSIQGRGVDIDTQSEFSVMTNESELKTNENILDFVIEGGEFYFEQFRQVLDERELAVHQKTLITFVSADFYNHDTETSQVAEGYRPVYKTQFSFKNKVDDFYVQYVQRQSLKLDVFISKSNAAIHLGQATVQLRELWERETALQEASGKSPVITQTVRVIANGLGGAQNVTVGNLQVKLRMRKPLTEAARFFREKNEIKNLTSTAGRGAGDFGPRRKMISVNVIGCANLSSSYSSADQIAPFFYYQFYNFDERYSQTVHGSSAMFEDVQPYEVTHDHKLDEYLQSEALEIILFDDNAPVAGVAKGGQNVGDNEQNEDMIGTVKVPLDCLIKGVAIMDDFPIRGTKGEPVGKLKVNIQINDIDGRTPFSQNQGSMAYNQEWEADLVYRIAAKLARFGLANLEMIFSIFARGDKFVHKEDFKYCILYRLRLKQQISEVEIDRFLEYNQFLAHKETLDLYDFKSIFEQPIFTARNEASNLQVMQQETINNAR
jgi:hypothetical protein